MKSSRVGSRRDPDRYLLLKRGIYYYRRRVPLELAEKDSRSPEVKTSLRTDDLARARAIRDAYERADNDLWAALIAELGDPWERFRSAQRIARAMGFSCQPTEALAAGPVEEILRRIEALSKGAPSKPVVEAVLGLADEPPVTLEQAFAIYLREIVAHELSGKSEAQRTRWVSGKRQSVRHFVEVVGDLDIRDITRDTARKYHAHWMGKIAPQSGPATHTADIANRRLGDLSVLYKSYFSHLGEPDRDNPFDRLRFKDKGLRKRKRPPFSHKWIVERLLKPGALARMNPEARGIFLVAANTGARLSEIANLVPDRIILNHEVPHVRIEPDESPQDRREIKTESSIRVLPLVGLALDVMKRFPAGFPRYRDKGDRLSAAVNKYLLENGLLESDRHSFYSLRHSFEDRMKDAKVDSELRKILMGHALDRPEYGEGGSLKLRQAAMEAVALPYHPAII